MLDVDPDQPRLDNFGAPAELPEGHAGQVPEVRLLGAHAVELAPDGFTPLSAGTMVFDSPEREDAVDFAELPVVTPGEELWSGPLRAIEPGSYEYLRVSVSFQQYMVVGHAEVSGMPIDAEVEIASFVEGSTYIEQYELGDEVVSVGAVKPQGYYGAWSQYTGVIEGQAPAGATTVPNPIDETSPIPVGSCVVTGAFDQPLMVTGDETSDLVVHVTLSTNRSFEWEDDGDGLWEPFAEDVVDMGVRGMEMAVR